MKNNIQKLILLCGAAAMLTSNISVYASQQTYAGITSAVHEYMKESVDVTEYSECEDDDANNGYIAAVPLYNIDLSDDLQEYTYEMCSYYQIPEYYELILGQMMHESRFNVGIISKTNDYGLMQINKSNHKYLNSILGNGDYLNAEHNIKAGVYLMSSYLHKYCDIEKALVAYNMGEAAIKRGITSTKYSRAVLRCATEVIVTMP